MAKQMGFSVVGLPHYTIWHLYEPSVDDIRHMEEMEEQRKARDKEEQEQADLKEGPKGILKNSRAQSEMDESKEQPSNPEGGNTASEQEHP